MDFILYSNKHVILPVQNVSLSSMKSGVLVEIQST